MVAKGHSEAPPFVPLQQGMVTKWDDMNGRVGSIFLAPDLQLERGTSSRLEHNHFSKIRDSYTSTSTQVDHRLHTFHSNDVPTAQLL
jgi:hypothetical protein